MVIRILAFARVRELVGFGERSVEMANGSSAEQAWSLCEARNGELAALRASTRLALNGRIVNPDVILHEGDELALFPPIGGG